MARPGRIELGLATTRGRIRVGFPDWMKQALGRRVVIATAGERNGRQGTLDLTFLKARPGRIGHAFEHRLTLEDKIEKLGLTANQPAGKLEALGILRAAAQTRTGNAALDDEIGSERVESDTGLAAGMPIDDRKTAQHGAIELRHARLAIIAPTRNGADRNAAVNSRRQRIARSIDQLPNGLSA